MWHLGHEGGPRPGYDYWVSFDGHGNLFNPRLNEDGVYTKYEGYITDLLNERAVEFVSPPPDKPFPLFFPHKAVHPAAGQAADAKPTPHTGNGTKPGPPHDRHRPPLHQVVG